MIEYTLTTPEEYKDELVKRINQLNNNKVRPIVRAFHNRKGKITIQELRENIQVHPIDNLDNILEQFPETYHIIEEE